MLLVTDALANKINNSVVSLFQANAGQPSEGSLFPNITPYNQTHQDLASTSYNTIWPLWQQRTHQNNTSLDWVCDETTTQDQCQRNPPNPSNWTFSYNYTGVNAQSPENHDLTLVSYCLGSKVQARCTVELIPTFLYIVIACNAIKAVALFCMVYLKLDPLLTIGEAVGSFLDSPDPTTEGSGALSAKDVHGKFHIASDGQYYLVELNQGQAYASGRRLWFYGASPYLWTFTLLT